MLELKLLGSPQIVRNGHPLTALSSAKSQALLFYLALTGRPQARLGLAELLWPEKREAEALANLRQAIYHLRNALPNYLTINRQTVALNPDLPCHIDVLGFEKALAVTTTFAARQAAVDRYAGEFLTGFFVEDAAPFEAWAVVMRERLHHLATEALHQLVAHFTERQEIGLGLRYTNQWLALEPWREEAHRYKLRFLAWDGQRQAALDHYERCQQVLTAELGAEPEAETVALYVQIRDGQWASVTRRQSDPETGRQDDGSTELAEVRAPSLAFLIPSPPVETTTPPHNLSTHRRPLIGREAELAHVCQLVLAPVHRLVTVVGAGGVGKTQLALVAAQTILDAELPPSPFADGTPQDAAHTQSASSKFPDGVWFVPLAGVAVGLPDPEAMVVSAICQALQLTPTGQAAPRQQLINYLQPRQLLLVLDHFDHLLAATDLLAWFLHTAPQLCLFVTAQTALGLEAEVVTPLAGLSTPAQDDDPQALAYGSVRLFRERAGRAWPAFSPAGEPVRSVIRICRLVAGLPLGIELVASWAAYFPYGEIEQALDENLAQQKNALTGRPEAQHSLQAVCAFVWQGLTSAEQTALAGATVFHGSFSRAAFLAVTKARLTDLVSLNDRALVQQDGVGRYVMHERVRQFASRKLDTLIGGGEEARNRHAEYYANFLQTCDQALKSAGQPQAVAAIQLDLHNVHAVWQRAILLCHLPTIEKVQESLWSYYYLQGRYAEGEALFARAATALHLLDTGTDARPAQHDLALGQVLSWQGWFQMQMGRTDEALEILQQSLARFARARDRMHRTLAYAHLGAGQIHTFFDEPALAITHLTQGLTHAQECGDPWGSAYATLLLGPLTMPMRQYRQLSLHYQESLATLRMIGDPLLLVNCLLLGAHTAIGLGAYDQAEIYLTESQQMSQALGSSVGLLHTRICLGELYRLRGQYDAAKASCIVCLPICTATVDNLSLTAVLYNLGCIAYAVHFYAEAKQHLQESLRLAEQSDCQWAVVMALTMLGYVDLQLGEWPAAKVRLQKSYIVAQQLARHEDLTASALGGLATVYAALGSYAEAEANYQQALAIAVQVEALPLLLDLLVGLAALRFKTGSSAPEQIDGWLALACQHPASIQATKDRATRLTVELASTAPPAASTAVLVSAPERDWSTMVTTILAAGVE